MRNLSRLLKTILNVINIEANEKIDYQQLVDVML